MQAEQVMQVVVRERGKLYADLRIEATSVLVGSAGHADVRLPVGEAAGEQMRVQIRQGELFAELVPDAPDMSLRGHAFRAALVRPDDVLSLGPFELQFALREGEGRARSSRTARLPRAPLFGALAVFCAWLVTALDQEVAQHPLSLPKAPPLFTSGEGVDCPLAPSAYGPSALGELERQAAIRSARSPFVPDEGVRAVLLLQGMATCMVAHGQAVAAERVRSDARKLAAIVERDYHLHEVRLYRALQTSDLESAQAEARVLSALLDAHPSDYTTFLSSLTRSLDAEAQLSRVASKTP